MTVCTDMQLDSWRYKLYKMRIKDAYAIRSMSLIRQEPSTECKEGSGYGIGRSMEQEYVYVDLGCRGFFEICFSRFAYNTESSEKRLNESNKTRDTYPTPVNETYESKENNETETTKDNQGLDPEEELERKNRDTNLPMLFLITPSGIRYTQRADLTRLSYTLK